MIFGPVIGPPSGPVGDLRIDIDCTWQRRPAVGSGACTRKRQQIAQPRSAIGIGAANIGNRPSAAYRAAES